ncbi:MAG: hypothetical protein PHU62_00735 [Bacteroidales bacterium]|nr:hypothetical protein [Bacteroidales bacterium]MDD2204299.1 hypothetical protein [Bacteroidales bacterium]MDD3151351.1 hypothetical protein [Bacteroidales bacterium]MDD3913180.1 hypothetical protein [Bacteroidales bacterium]MDD4633095.1 hypothetical protein [Bacteroidales bacterium]
MNSKCNIAAIQFTPLFRSMEANIAAINNIIGKTNTDIIVFPELSISGYAFINKEDALEYSQTADELAYLTTQNDDNKSVIIIGFAERQDDKVYNSALILFPDKTYKVYRKTHLFYNERFCFSEGDSGFFVVQHPFCDCRIGIMICYDWRFPESARTLALQGADIIVCPANLVTPLWEIGMKSRALENNVYLSVANRCGIETQQTNGKAQSLHFTGKSVIYDTKGQEMAQAGAVNDDIIVAELDVSVSRDKSFNSINDIFKDRRSKYYMLQ